MEEGTGGGSRFVSLFQMKKEMKEGKQSQINQKQ